MALAEPCLQGRNVNAPVRDLTGEMRNTLPVSSSSVLVVADVHGLASRGGELRVLLDGLASSSRSESLCLDFRVLAVEEPGEFVLLSHWSEEAALDVHYATPHYHHYRRNVGPMLARPSDVRLHYVTSTVQALDPNPPDPERAD
jgi:quinol monooxygenase YgiN